jgi:hypothetical protein
MRTVSILTIFTVLVVVSGTIWGEEKVVDWSQTTHRDDLRYEGNSEKPFTGKLVKYYPNGQQAMEFGYCDGIQHGKQILWQENGQKGLEGECKHGKLDGVMTAWYKDGNKSVECDYSDGKLYRSASWHPNGKKESDNDYPDGKSGEDFVTPLAIAKEMRLMGMWTHAMATVTEPAKCIQCLDSPDGEHKYALYHDVAGGDDHEWFVTKLKVYENPDALIVPKSFMNCSTPEEREWMDKTILFNWSEAGEHRENPHIKLVGDRYLVFERGGLYHGLYDIQEEETLITEESPWHSYIYSEEYESIKPQPSHEQRKQLLDDWVRRKLHEPIKEIIDK